jgi:hypothetical protein
VLEPVLWQIVTHRCPGVVDVIVLLVEDVPVSTLNSLP